MLTQLHLSLIQYADFNQVTKRSPAASYEVETQYEMRVVRLYGESGCV